MHRLLIGSGSAALVAIWLITGSVAATAQTNLPPRFEFGAFGGVMDYDVTRAVGGQIYGGRLGLNLTPRFGFEAVFGTSRAKDSVGRVSRIWLSHADLVLHLMPSAFTPYISGGFGNLSSTTTGYSSQEQLHFDVGGGVKLWLSDHLGLRGDIHSYWGRASATIDREAGYTGDAMASVSVVIGAGSLQQKPDDTDGDGVSDLRDRCPGTPIGVSVDTFGCPPDTDRDGVADHRDRCAGTTLHAWVDLHGCQTDDDADGVADGIDRCLDTPRGAEVDVRGCPRDTDGDGVYNGLDKCLDTPTGTDVDVNGCPEVKQIERKLVLHSINFASGKADILPISYDSLDEVAESLVAYQAVKMEIRGYADAMGDESLNLSLTQARAEAVRTYLIRAGVEATRLRARGYGELEPIAPNSTAEGRAMNRRVEFHRVD